MRLRIPGTLPVALLVAIAAGSLVVSSRGQTPPTVAEAEKFIADAEGRLNALSTRAARAQWVQVNFITDDTQAIAAEANEQLTAAVTELAKAATRFEKLDLPAPLARRILLLKLSLPAPAPENAAELAELTTIMASLEADYGKGRYCPPGKPCMDISEVEKFMRESRDPTQMLEIFNGWRSDRAAHAGPLHAVRRAGEQGRPRDGLHGRRRDVAFGLRHAARCVRARARPPLGAGPAALRIAARVRPRPAGEAVRCVGREAGRLDSGAPPGQPVGAAVGQHLRHRGAGGAAEGIRPHRVAQGEEGGSEAWCKYGERFFSSLGFAPLPQTFWERSLFVRPSDRDVVCHASAWSIDAKDDIRLKMCIEITGEDFVTVHHELGHNYYQRAYNTQSFLFQGSANDGFHEAVGDTIALSVTPAYLQTIGLLDEVPPAEADIPLLLRRRFDKVAFLPFGLLIDQWRWGVFSGQITPATYNTAWWDLKQQVPGRRVARRLGREKDFDPGAKYHVPANTPYSRYFLARILQYQFHRALCREAGYTGPLNRCSIYGNKQAGARLEPRCSAMGLSQPWPDALEALTGRAPDGRDGDPRLLRAAQEVARRAEQGRQGRVEHGLTEHVRLLADRAVGAARVGRNLTDSSPGPWQDHDERGAAVAGECARQRAEPIP